MRRGVVRVLTPWLLWSIPAAFITVLTVRESGQPLWRVAASEFLPWYYWAFLTPSIVRFAKAHPPETLRTLRGILLHLGNALVIGAGCGAFAVLVDIALDMPTHDMTPAQLFSYSIMFWSVFGIMFYALITAVAFVGVGQARVREREVAASQLEARLVEAQLNSLRMQLQPHFLFNTLNTAAMYVRDGDADTSIRVLTRLSELLRRLLDTSAEQEVTLALELEHVERYLEIESLRFSDRLHVRIDVPVELRSALVPNLALQPLVENAVRHGVAKRSEAGTIAVSAHRVGEELIIEITNDGPALPRAWRMDEAAGIGLRNTRMRLEHLYGGRARLGLGNNHDGVLCTLTLPYRTAALPISNG